MEDFVDSTIEKMDNGLVEDWRECVIERLNDLINLPPEDYLYDVVLGEKPITQELIDFSIDFIKSDMFSSISCPPYVIPENGDIAFSWDYFRFHFEITIRDPHDVTFTLQNLRDEDNPIYQKCVLSRNDIDIVMGKNDNIVSNFLEDILTSDKKQDDTSIYRTSESYGFIYAIGMKGYRDIFKIGYTTNINTRLKSIQMHNPFELYMFYKFGTLKFKEAEKYIHKKLSSHNLRGEWFQVGKMTLKSIMNEADSIFNAEDEDNDSAPA